jgi:hypothetical protein
MAKKFMYVCLGILALVVAFHLGARHGSASIVDHSTTGIVAAYADEYDDWCWVLMDSGDVWRWNTISGWLHSTNYTVPVPVSEIKFWSFGIFVTTDNELWRGEGGVWQNIGSPPAGPTLTQPTTWSRIKAGFGE